MITAILYSYGPQLTFYNITTFHLSKYKIYCAIVPSFSFPFLFISFYQKVQNKGQYVTSFAFHPFAFLLSSQPQTYGTLLIIDSRIWACHIAIAFFYWIFINTYTCLSCLLHGQLFAHQYITSLTVH